MHLVQPKPSPHAHYRVSSGGMVCLAVSTLSLRLETASYGETPSPGCGKYTYNAGTTTCYQVDSVAVHYFAVGTANLPLRAPFPRPQPPDKCTRVVCSISGAIQCQVKACCCVMVKETTCSPSTCNVQKDQDARQTVQNHTETEPSCAVTYSASQLLCTHSSENPCLSAQWTRQR